MRHRDFVALSCTTVTFLKKYIQCITPQRFSPCWMLEYGSNGSLEVQWLRRALQDSICERAYGYEMFTREQSMKVLGQSMSQHAPQVLTLNLEKSCIIPSQRTTHSVREYNQGCNHIEREEDFYQSDVTMPYPDWARGRF